MTGTQPIRDFGAQSDRRRNPRAECRLSVDVVASTGKSFDPAIKAKTTNISLDGICLRIPEDLPVGSSLSLVVYYAGYDSICLGEIVWKVMAEAGTICGIKVKHWSFLDFTLRDLLTRKV